MNEIIDSLIKQAGVDFEARPILVISACHLPDPAKFDYDLVLQEILHKLDDYVESDYVIVLFTAGGEFRMSWRWLFKAYRALGRKYKKNLKNLYIVHANRWMKLLLDLMKTVISPKFGRKIVNCPTLSKLSEHVPYRQIQVPSAVFDHNVQFESFVKVSDRHVASSPSGDTRQFGVALETLMGPAGERGLPAVISYCIRCLRSMESMNTEGLFRRSPSSVQLKQFKDTFDSRQLPNIEEYDSVPHLCAVAVKLFLRELPSPLLPESIYGELAASLSSGGSSSPRRSSATVSAKTLSQLICLIPEPSKLLFVYLLKYFRELTGDPQLVANHKMTPANIGIVVGPNLVRHENPVLEMEYARLAGQFVSNCLNQWSDLESSSALAKTFDWIRKQK